MRKLILAQQGLLRWRGGQGAFTEGVPWNELYQGVSGTLEVLKKLEAVQLDPVAVVERNHHLVFLNRVEDYKTAFLEALYPQKLVFEYWAQARCVMPIEDWPLFEWRREHWRLEHTLQSRHRHNTDAYNTEIFQAVAYIKERLTQKDPLPARLLDTGKRVLGYWGFTHKATSQAIEHLWEAGELVVAQRANEERYFALTSDWLPTTVRRGGAESAESRQGLLLKFIRAYGVVDASDPRLGWHNWSVGERKSELARLSKAGHIVPLDIKDAKLRRTYYLWSQLIPLLAALQNAIVSPRVYFLSPLDNLLWRRERVLDLWGFDYKWEIYVPEHRRTYGPYVLPILEGEHLVGRLDARLDRKNKQLEVRRVFWEQEPDKRRVARIEKALEGFAERLGVSRSR
ncbi:DNA glycosylase AlkZ-like family protein [Meiothermus cerbereus]|uniref:DNA glycosylase AlkZ-like family protein n=1 Tax=Meiothermus cerbereus TaxID=65552 RepID=UPI003EF05CA5